MEYFDNANLEKFLSWTEQLDAYKICKDFINSHDDLKDMLIVFNINGIQDDYYDILIHISDNIKENIIDELQSFEFIDEDLKVIISDEVEYPEDALYFFNIYIENRESGLKILYGTYYPEGFEVKYEVINEGF